MQSCSVHHCVLFLLTLTLTTVPTLASNSVIVKLYQPATLNCERNCSGVGKWVPSDNRSVTLAECNQTSCWSEEGYKMFYDQYMAGCLSLTITAADYSKRNWYTCECDDKDVNQLRLIIETLTSPVELNPGKDLVMDLPIADPVEVVYKAKDSAGLYGEQICTGTQHTLQCKAEYTPRTSLSPTNITLRDVQLNDSGSYTIRDTENNEVMHIYTLFVKEVQGQQSHLLVWLLAVLILMAVVCIIVVVCFLVKRRTKCLEQQEQQELKHAESLEYTKSLQSLWDWLNENMHIHEKRTAYTWQRRAYSDTDLARIRHKKRLEMFIKQYRAREIHVQERNMDTNFSSESTGYELPPRSYSDSYHAYIQLKPVFLDEYFTETKPIRSQQEACGDNDVGKVTIQDKAGAVTVNQRNITAKCQPHVQ
ncbi:uncharacterized protein LOC128509701 [Clarias gariepinus]|uniref:uncharacterized protein LOC128509701 n=1 Tax=Clarias gariepinus TaxID=13013 RepID=UPI00234DE7E3|nr:uncharacterized protein LOC128509701 [Clarias gariepinus]